MLIYIASPYTHQDKSILNKRVSKLETVVAFLLNFKYNVISPVLHNHYMFNSNLLSETTDWSFWKLYCCAILEKCDELWVYMDDGWDSSVGVTAEIKYATEHDIKIKYFNLIDDTIVFKKN